MDLATSHAAQAGSGPRQSPACGAGATPHRDPLFAAILAYIERHLDDEALDARTLQRVFRVSRPTLYRMFRPAGGIARFIRDQRLAAAHRHLRSNPDCSITWLLYEVGFASERQFQRAFQARYRLSPARWRELCRAEAPPARRRHSNMLVRDVLPS
ncbi:helix-turn-helix domain-containing protein [Coralloluteibacterium thermophilus]|uniref:Helix-turn-helix domain-containing protein n=1 Tax=Coralloluteibacterium thermophilum TaxID=2707049 RepID=A0ABV9NNF9_9GAMM